MTAEDEARPDREEDSPSSPPPSNAPKTFEEIIDHLGAFGHWQRVIFILLSLADVHGAFAMLLPVFIGAAPRWRCDRLEGLSENDTQKMNLTWRECEVNNTECANYGFYDGFTSIVSEWDLVCGSDYISDLISTIQMSGLLFGAAAFAQLSDLLGRKKSFFLAYLFLITPGFVSAFSGSWQVYATCRFLVGVGYGSSMVINCVYPLEFVGQRWRLLCGTVGFWGLGQMILALIAHFVRDWRHLAIASTISGVPYFLLWWVIPESPRWLAQQRRFKEAEVILATIARRNKRPPPDISHLKHVAELEEQENKRIRRYTYLDLFRRWRYAKTTLINLLAWFTAFVCYYEITYNLKNLSGNRYLNMFLSGLVDLTAMISVILILNVLGRRRSMALYLSIIIASLMSILVIVVTGNKTSAATGVLVLALIGKSGALAGTYVMQIFSAELYPTVIRNLGVGAGAVAARLGSILAPQLVYLGTIATVAPYIICSVLSVCVFPLMFLLPETNGKPLEDAFDQPTKDKEAALADNTTNAQLEHKNDMDEKTAL